MRIEWVKYTMLRGMEIVVMRDKTYFVRIGSIWDLFYFFVDIRYLKLLEFVGWWKYLYVPVRAPEYTGTYFYLFPIGAWIYLCRYLRRAWFYPFMLLHRAGYTNLSEGALPALLWPVHLSLRRHHRPSGDDVL
jgi:hypothetical protein